MGNVLYGYFKEETSMKGIAMDSPLNEKIIKKIKRLIQE